MHLEALSLFGRIAVAALLGAVIAMTVLTPFSHYLEKVGERRARKKGGKVIREE